MNVLTALPKYLTKLFLVQTDLIRTLGSRAYVIGFIGTVEVASGSSQIHKRYLSDSRASGYCGQTVQRTCKLLMHQTEARFVPV